MAWTLYVENIKCGGCANRIKTSLMDQHGGISGVEVDVATGGVTLEGDEGLRAEVRESLKGMGYPEVDTVEGVEALKAKAKSFVSCAIGRMSDD